MSRPLLVATALNLLYIPALVAFVLGIREVRTTRSDPRASA